MEQKLVIPRHIGFIMDGNGRWAKMRGKPRNYGHVKGADRVDEVVSNCFSYGVECITLYAFSTENWSRPKQEVDKIMNILYNFLKKYNAKLNDNQVRLKVSGDTSKLNKKTADLIYKTENETARFTSKTLNIAVNYGSKQEILHAVNTLLKSGKTEASLQDFENALYTAGMPDIDLVVRTSGESRISNFFLWQTAYAELYFTNTLWPDFDKAELQKAIEWFSLRNRRFGNV